MDSIIFDVDGTLWDSTFVVADAWGEIIKKHHNPNAITTAESLKAQFGKLLPDIAAALFPDLEKDAQITLIERCCEAEHQALLDSPPAVYDGMEETIKKLYETYPLYIVSNCQAGYIEVFLKATGLGAYFEDHLCPGDTGQAKAWNIQEIIRKHDLKNPIYVGDTMGDYHATRESGIPFVFASYGFGKVDTPDFTISRPLDLLNL